MVQPEEYGAGRDIVVVGASAGGVEALVQLVRGLPDDFGGSVFVVLHVPPSGSVLPGILSRAGPLPARHAEDGERIEGGRIYVAPPDHHLTLKRDGIRIERGPRENGHRPAIDPLFRSAARTFGRRVAGIVLSGARDDGTAGLSAIKVRGGLTIVQDPEDALYPAMPLSAIEYVDPDYVLPAGGIAELVAGAAQKEPVEEGVMDEHREVSELAKADHRATEHPQSGTPSTISCPECGGVLWQTTEGELARFRCRIGHAFSDESLIAEHSESLETALSTALRALEEHAALCRRTAGRLKGRGHMHAAARFERQAEHVVAQSATIQTVLRTLEFPPEATAEATQAAG
jgi:two-component system, chemotaxis family, protein-glutamate methylesterase/glutaminase